MITLGVFAPTAEDATSWYRAYGPLRYVRQAHDLEIIALEPHTCNWSHITRCDIILVQRASMQAVWLRPLQMARKLGVPVWCDYDDDMFAVPFHSPVHFLYDSDESKDIVKQYLKESDCVTVTTQSLADAFSWARTEPITIAPNALDPAIRINTNKKRIHNKVHIVWRGGASHSWDLFWAREFFLNLDPKRFHVTFLGSAVPSFIDEHASHVTIMNQPFPVFDYLSELVNLRPDYVVVPLLDDKFNRGKSDIAYLEATMAHALCIAPDWAPWNENKGILLYNHSTDFATQALQLIDKVKEEGSFLNRLAAAHAHVAQHRLANNPALVETRWKMITDAVGRAVR